MEQQEREDLERYTAAVLTWWRGTPEARDRSWRMKDYMLSDVGEARYEAARDAYEVRQEAECEAVEGARYEENYR